jgi:uncharacterized protein YoxC
MSSEIEVRINTEIAWIKGQFLAANEAGLHAQAENFQKALLILQEDLRNEHEHQRKQDSKRQRLDVNYEVLNAVAELPTSVAELQTSVAELQTSVAELQTSVAELKTSVAELQTSVAELKTSVTDLANSNAELKTSVTDLANSNAELKTSVAKLEIKVEDVSAILPHRYVEGVRLASVNILSTTGSSIGVAVFVSQRRIISALHVFTTHYGYENQPDPDTVIQGLLHRPNEQEENVTFRLVNYNERFDLAVLELDDAYGDANYSLELPAVDSDQIWRDNVAKFQAKLAVTSFTSAVAMQAPDVVDVSFCVIPATPIKLTRHHLLYMSQLFSGDSSGALLVTSDGSLRGLHLQTVNQANEQLRIGAPPDDMVASINSLISGLSSGFIGLRLDVQEVQDIILN